MKSTISLPVILSVILIGCNSNNEQYPPGTQVSISPSSYTWTVRELQDVDGNCIYDSSNYQDNVVQISVSDSEGRPIGDVDISMYLSPSNSTSPPEFNNEYVFYLYDDFNGNGVVDHPQELVSSTGDPILYETKTEKYHGTKTMIIRTNTSCGGYKATLNVYAGQGYGSMGINTDSEEDG